MKYFIMMVVISLIIRVPRVRKALTRWAVFAIKFPFDFLTYKRTTYYSNTKASYFSLIFDKGKYGEYILYKKLKKFENKRIEKIK